MRIKALLYLILLTLSFASLAKPKILVKYQRNVKNFQEIQVVNQTAKQLICYIAVDGHKIRFKLQPRQPSKWYQATDPTFNPQNVSTWCDYLSLHTKYQTKP